MKLRELTLLFVLACFVMIPAASATCAAPSKPGAVLCFPSANATVTGSFNIEGAATGDGLPIRSMIVYIDNKKTYSFTDTDTFVQADYLGYSNGLHHLVLNAWDSDGHLFQASATFNYITGINGNYNVSCTAPANGIKVCLPLPNTAYPEILVPITLAASSAIKSAKVYVNNQLTTTITNFPINTGFNVAPSGSPFTLTVDGFNSSGRQISVTGVSNLLTYYDGACIRNCDPGVAISSPPQVTDQGTSFTVSAEVKSNPHPITDMRVYLDNSAVLNSSGPTITGSVKASPGTHLITVQAWDTEKALYKTQESINVQ